jgi:hypothetical protein
MRDSKDVAAKEYREERGISRKKAQKSQKRKDRDNYDF